MEKQQAIMDFLNGMPWAITQPGLDAIRAILLSKGLAPRQGQVRATGRGKTAAAPRPKANAAGNVAVLSMSGPIVPKASWMTEFFGGCPLNTFAAQLRMAVADPNIKAIVINVDSPGGSVSGVPEMAAIIRAATDSKHIVGVASCAASAAYWLASQCSELVVAPSGEVGSIGVVAVHEDWSGAYAQAGVKCTIVRTPATKYEGNYMEPLTPAAQADMQAKIDTFYSMFIADVALGRGVSKATASGPAFGVGRCLLAQDAVKNGMADRVATLSDVLAELGGGTMTMGGRLSTKPKAEAEDPAPAPAAADASDEDFTRTMRTLVEIDAAKRNM